MVDLAKRRRLNNERRASRGIKKRRLSELVEEDPIIDIRRVTQDCSLVQRTLFFKEVQNMLQEFLFKVIYPPDSGFQTRLEHVVAVVADLYQEAKILIRQWFPYFQLSLCLNFGSAIRLLMSHPARMAVHKCCADLLVCQQVPIPVVYMGLPASLKLSW